MQVIRPLFMYATMVVLLLYCIARRTICIMQDIRIERWARTLVHYSLYIKAGDTVAIHATPLATPLVEAVYRELLSVGAHPLPLIELESLEEILYVRAMNSNLPKSLLCKLPL